MLGIYSGYGMCCRYRMCRGFGIYPRYGIYRRRGMCRGTHYGTYSIYLFYFPTFIIEAKYLCAQLCIDWKCKLVPNRANSNYSDQFHG